jgi:simple sugar transport system substrate-binding protein
MTRRTLIFALCMLALPLAGCVEKAAGPAAGGQAAYRFTVIIYDSPGNPFWTKVVTGAREMADLLGCTVDIQYADGEAPKQKNIMQTAVANNVDGIGVALNYDDAYDDAVQEAIDKGIPVIAFNIDDSQGMAGNARMAYIGQDMETAGYMIAKRLVQEAGLKEGDFVACPVESPEAVYAVQRYAGVRRALGEHGITSEVVNTGTVSLADTTANLTQFLIGRKNTAAICAMGQMPMEAAPQAAANAGLDLPNAGFDLSRQIAENIIAGKSLATVDQQPFYQGAQTVLQLFFYQKYGLLPCDINTGGAIVDKARAESILELSDSVR